QYVSANHSALPPDESTPAADAAVRVSGDSVSWEVGLMGGARSTRGRERRSYNPARRGRLAPERDRPRRATRPITWNAGRCSRTPDRLRHRSGSPSRDVSITPTARVYPRKARRARAADDHRRGRYRPRVFLPAVFLRAAPPLFAEAPLFAGRRLAAVFFFAVVFVALPRFAVLRFVVVFFAVVFFAVPRFAAARFAVARFAVPRFGVARLPFRLRAVSIVATFSIAGGGPAVESRPCRLGMT